MKEDLSGILPGATDKAAFVVIWTTTPWTIPANLAVALHPDYRYEGFDIGSNEVLILAEELAEKCMKTFGISDFKKIGQVNPRDLEGKKCAHPLYDRDSLLILGEHVTLDAGTGCVHTAPGHGREDHEAALKYGLDIYSPVDDGGCFTGDVGLFGGQFVLKANTGITEKLKENGALLAHGEIAHSYPHCWRCKKPVIFRSTPQWFISMEKTGLRKKALEAIDTVQWIPGWGRDRIYGMVENRPDWCISRQRVWGVPIALFSCEACDTLLMDKKAMDHICDQFEKVGADIWFEKSPEELLPGDVRCQACGQAKFRKENDILDVWFDSGVSHAAVLEQRDTLKWPADLYLEGTDQHRGWFQSSLLAAVGNRGKAPYRSVLTCGFVVDADGKKMSKSLGNFIAPDVLIQKYGAEILRLWVSASDYQDDIRISENILKQLSDAYRRIRNTSRFMLGNLFDFDPDLNRVDYSQMKEIDRFALHRLQSLIAKVKKGYENYEFHQIYHALFNFCTLDLSAFYLDILKDRLYTSPPNSLDRRSAQTVMHMLLDTMAKLMAPILCFTAEEIWSHMPAVKDKTQSIHLTEMPDVNEAWIDESLENNWALILNIRAEVTKVLETARVNKSIGHSLDARVVLYAEKALLEKIQPYEKEIASLFIVSEAGLQIMTPEENGGIHETGLKGLKINVFPAPGDKCERCWIHDTSVGQSNLHPTLCKRCETALESL
jgi:isoleucyl-tRNA synthetase